MNRIWNGGLSESGGPDLSSLMTEEDNLVDSNLVKHEILGLMAYHLELARTRILDEEDTREILKALLKNLDANLSMTTEFEDVHTLVEEKVKLETESGKNLRIFLSRNDQSHYDIRSFYLDQLLVISGLLIETAGTLNSRFSGIEGYMAGYTHYRQAMPVAVATYFDYISASLLNLAEESLSLFGKLSEYCPLGYGSGYGTALPINRKAVAVRLGFRDTFNNPMLGASYRGVDEVNVVFLEARIMTSISRFAQDLMTFSSDEFGFVHLPSGFTTGSSLMPNKRNPDFLEMLQGYASESLGVLTSSLSILMNKGSGYHREFQLSKDKVVTYTLRLAEILKAFSEMSKGLEINIAGAEGLVDNSANATMEAYNLFSKGTPWKDAYAKVGQTLREGGKLNSYEPVPQLSTEPGRIRDLETTVDRLKKGREELALEIIGDVKAFLGS